MEAVGGQAKYLLIALAAAQADLAKNDAEGKKPDTKAPILYDFTCMKYLEQACSETESRTEVSKSRGMGNRELWGWFQSVMMTTVRDRGDRLYNIVNVCHVTKPQI